VFWFSWQLFVWNISHSKKNWARCYHKCTCLVGLHVKYPLLSSYFIETWIIRQIFEKYSNINFGENPSGWEPSYSMRAGGRRTDMKPVACFRNFANAPKMRMEQSWDAAVHWPDDNHESRTCPLSVFSSRDLSLSSHRESQAVSLEPTCVIKLGRVKSKIALIDAFFAQNGQCERVFAHHPVRP